MTFRFLVRYLGFMKHVPLAAWMVDAIMFLGYCFFKNEIIKTIERIESEVSAWNGVNVTLHKFGGLQFNYQHKEIGHLHSNGILDILFNKATKTFLLEKGLATDHHVFPNSGWISFYIRQEGDDLKAVRLLELAYCKRILSMHSNRPLITD